MPQSCCYLLRVGMCFYVGSTGSLVRRIRDHVWRLRSGKHPNESLQAAWDLLPESHEVECLEECSGGRDELRAIEQRWIDEYKARVGMVNKSVDSRGPGILASERMKELWADPLFRDRASKCRVGVEFSACTRAKMAESKRGALNPKAKGCWVLMPDGERLEFGALSEAARHLGVTQQAVDGWLRGLSAIPGRGRHTRYKGLEGMDIGYLDGVGCAVSESSRLVI